MKIDEIISAVQSSLGVEVDGKAGPETWGAIYAKIVKPSDLLQESVIDPVDSRSEKNITTLLAEVQPYARSLVHKAAAVGVTIKIISGLRTYEEQDTLYAQGRTINKDKDIVTNAKGGQSNHNFGIAFDIGVFEGTKYLKDSPKYKTVGILGVELGLEWGGNWKTIVDQPHFQLRPTWAKSITEKEMLAELRSRKESGQSYYT